MSRQRIFLLLITASSTTTCVGPRTAMPPHYLPPCPPPLPQAKRPVPATDAGWTGMSEASALARARALGLPCRVTEREGRTLPATMDYSAERLNFSVARGQVVRVTRG